MCDKSKLLCNFAQIFKEIVMRKRFIHILWAVFGTGILTVILAFVAIWFGMIGYMPDIEDLQNPINRFATQVYSADGKVLGTWNLNKENRIVIPYKKMSPYLIKGNDGMWHCLWSVHEGYAVFAHCVSTDLISWGQQAFPTTGNTGNCMNPSVAFSPTGQDYLITWNSLQGENTKTYSCRTKDFRTYSIPQAENVAVLTNVNCS